MTLVSYFPNFNKLSSKHQMPQQSKEALHVCFSLLNNSENQKVCVIFLVHIPFLHLVM